MYLYRIINVNNLYKLQLWVYVSQQFKFKMNPDQIVIKPNLEYIQQLNKKSSRSINHHTDYLRKSNMKYLPSCSINHNQNKQKSKQKQISKKQIYEKIKRQNELLKQEQSIQQSKKNKQFNSINKQTNIIKKSQPANKNQNNIKQNNNNNKQLQNANTNQQKKPQKNKQENKIKSKNQQENQKSKYHKLLIQLQKQRQKLQNQKKQFQLKKQYLQFKKSIQNVQGLNIKPLAPITSSINSNNIINKNQSSRPQTGKSLSKNDIKLIKTNKSIQKMSRTNNDKGRSSVVRNIQKKQEYSKQKNRFNVDLLESKKLIANLTRKIEQIQVKNKDNSIMKKIARIQFNDGQELERINILNLHKIQDMDILKIGRQIEVEQLNHERIPHFNVLYKKIGEQKVIKSNKSRRQYENGCIQTNTNRFKCYDFTNEKYKITIFNNGDVKQQIIVQNDMAYISYYSKSKQLHKINYRMDLQIYYFYKLKQVEIHWKNSRKQILYNNNTIKKIDHHGKQQILKIIPNYTS